ncbi:MAG TPA: response regulator transcription factor [Woeseiaceae bacterium]|nr:response regulator transcription factor [Woeseiaceae bacterium]
MSSIRIALVDDHQIVRDGLSALLAPLRDIEVVAQAGSGREAVILARKDVAEVFIMDIAMSDLNGLEATKRITAANPGAKVIMLSMHASEEYVVRSLQNGARGYLVKNAAPEELEAAIRKVASGGVYLSPSIGDTMRTHILSKTAETKSQDILTSRQREILQAIAEGTSTRDIAEKLCISPKTVETHRSQIMQKLNINNVPGLVRYAIRHGIITVD